MNLRVSYYYPLSEKRLRARGFTISATLTGGTGDQHSHGAVNIRRLNFFTIIMAFNDDSTSP